MSLILPGTPEYNLSTADPSLNGMDPSRRVQSILNTQNPTGAQRSELIRLLSTLDVTKLNLDALSYQQKAELSRLLTPKLTQYIPHTPTPKQTAFLLLDNREALYGGAAGGGKALALDTPILTDSGWKVFGDITIEDKVLASDGSWSAIEYVTDIQLDHDCYAIKFNTGETIIADTNHLWAITEYKHRKYWQDRIVSTKELGVDQKIVSRGIVKGSSIDLDIDPYILGYWLGDGNARTGSITCHDSDVDNLRQYCTLIPYESMNMQYTVEGLTTQLNQLGLLRNKYDNRTSAPETKHIPEKFFLASIDQRLSLLQGIMDSDGSIQERGRCEIGLKEDRLATDVCSLLASLGIVFSHTIAPTSYKGKKLPSHRITFSTTMNVFRLPRKAARIPKKVLDNKIIISSIVPCQSVPVRCIRIKHPSHIFLVGRTLIPTHNSDAMLMAGLQYVDIKGYAGIIFRKTFADLSKPGALIERAKDWLFRFEDVKWNEKDKRMEFIKRYGKHTEIWSILQFGYMETENDKYNYQGGEYQFIGFDEVTHISESNYRYMFSRMRRLKGVDIPLRIRGASNPPDDDKGIWVYYRFVDQATRLMNSVFIPAGMNDNPFLDIEEYKQALTNLDADTQARLGDGKWIITKKCKWFNRNMFEIVPPSMLPPYRKIVRFWDMAASEVKLKKNTKTGKSKETDPDYTASLRLSVDSSGIYYIEDIIRARVTPNVTEQLQKNTAKRDGFSVAIREDLEPGSSGIAVIDMKARGIFQGYNYAGVRSTGKELRAQAVAAAAERGQIKIVSTCRNIIPFLDELEGFPFWTHDDMVDCLSGAYQELAALPVVCAPIVIERESSMWGDFDESTSIFEHGLKKWDAF